MEGFLLRAALKAAPEQVRFVATVPPKSADGLVAKVYAQLLHEFSVLAPPVVLHSAAPRMLAAAWSILRESLIAAGAVDRATREAVAAAVSLGNSCPYCVEVHGGTMHGLATGGDAYAVATGRLDDVADDRLRRIATWAKASGNRDLAAGHALDLPPEQAIDLAAVAVTFHYYNRMVNVFVADSVFPPVMPASARGQALRVFGRLMRPAAGQRFRPGDSLELLTPAPLPPDLAWLRQSRAAFSAAEAFARAAAAVDAAGRRSVPPAVRELVLAHLARWTGTPAGLSRAWVEDAIDTLPPADRSAGRLALLTAVASYQVDDDTVEQFRRERPADRPLIELVSWSALSAARRIGTWLAGTDAPRAGDQPAA